MKLFAIADLHLGRPENRQALLDLLPHPEDWLIVAGDVCENIEIFEKAMALLAQKFSKLFWTPGNHDLWTLPTQPDALRGLFRYNELVAICRRYGIHTPEDAYVRWPLSPDPLFIAPIFTLYDYSFCPPDVSPETAVSWAAETDVICNDEYLLHPDPLSSREEWSHIRCRYTETRLAETAPHGSLILASHFPLRYDLVNLPRIPRFSIWCGTNRTEDWHDKYPVTAVVYGHLHMRGTHYRDGIPHTEVSFGYPGQWHKQRGMAGYLHEIETTSVREM
jgi:hypothetical protein